MSGDNKMIKRVFLIILTALLLALSFGPAAAEMTLPADLRCVEEEVFAGDTAIERVIVPEGTAEIGPRAFVGCTGLLEITLPASLERIDETAFEDCGQLSVIFVTPYTWACRWAMSREYTVKETGTDTILTPFTYDTALKNVAAADSAEQIVLVAYQGGSSATLSVHEKQDGFWKQLWNTPAAVGRNGINKTREGDGRTPSGTFHLTTPFGILSDPGANMPYLKVTSQHYWCDDSSSPYYNRLVNTSVSGRVSGEHLIDYSGYYDYCMFIDYNASGVPGKGSCIFLHCKMASSTGGCVAIAKSRMIDILRWALPGVLIVIR